jgi:putative ABC transport system ATP-binding protein
MTWTSAQSRASEVCAAAGTGVLPASHGPVVVAAADRVVRLSDGLVVEG